MNEEIKKEKAPEHLRPETKEWWESVQSEYSLEKHQLRILTLAAESWDRCVEARELIQRDGLTYSDRFGQPRARPKWLLSGITGYLSHG